MTTVVAVRRQRLWSGHGDNECEVEQGCHGESSANLSHRSGPMAPRLAEGKLTDWPSNANEEPGEQHEKSSSYQNGVLFALLCFFGLFRQHLLDNDFGRSASNS